VNLIDEIFRPYEEGQAAVLLSDRSLLDLEIDATDGKLRPAVEILRREARRRHGMLCITYSLAGGVDWQSESLSQKDRSSIEGELRRHGFLDVAQDEHEVVRIMRAIASLSRTRTEALTWADGAPLRFAFLVQFAEHLMPCREHGNGQTQEQLVASELAHLTVQSLSLRASGHYVMFHGDGEMVDTLVRSALHHVRLKQPGEDQKRTFIRVARSVYTAARFEDGLGDDSVAYLTANTPNRGLESLLRASHRSQSAITVAELFGQKARDVEQLSEGTLTLLDPSGVESSDLAGINTTHARSVLRRFSDGLQREDGNLPANVLLAGPPGTGKTQLAQMTAHDARVAAYTMNSPKGPLVGMTERLARQQHALLRQWTPNVAVCDEITEAFPLERSDFDGDSGASRAVMAQMLSSLADESRRGKALLVATTNCPWRIGTAMRSRFTVIPVLHPLSTDFSAIVAALLRRVDPASSIPPNDEAVLSAAALFFEKGANPRHVRSSLNNALLLKGHLDRDAVVFAARDFCESGDRLSAEYADYWAIKCCSSLSLLPWSATPATYPYPAHLRGVVDDATGEIRHDELDRRIADLRQHANL
jgi:hypothetical protein